MMKKIVGFLVLTLLIAPVFPAVGTMNNEINNSTSLDRGWSDNFDDYALGQFLDGDPTDGGWKGWDNDPSYGAYVTDSESYSPPYSLEIKGISDLIHEFSGYTTGKYYFSVMQYFTYSDYSTYLMLLSDYHDYAGQDNEWAVQLFFDGFFGDVTSEYDDVHLYLKTDEWINIECYIDLDADWVEIYYDGDLLHEKPWTACPDNSGDGLLNIAAVELYGNGGSAVYYDDILLIERGEPSICCLDDIAQKNVKPGETVVDGFIVENCGEPGSLLWWQIIEYPTWGTWQFNPQYGFLSEGQTTSVSVTIEAPDETNTPFTGEVKIRNVDDSSDTCSIPVSLKTPRNKPSNFNNLSWLFERFPNAFPILRFIIPI